MLKVLVPVDGSENALRAVQQAVRLRLASLHGSALPKDDIVYGREGREGQMERWLTVLRAIGAAGVPSTGLTLSNVGGGPTSWPCSSATRPSTPVRCVVITL